MTTFKSGDKVKFSNKILNRTYKSSELIEMIQRQYMILIPAHNGDDLYRWKIVDDLCDSVWSDSAFTHYGEPVKLPEDLFTI